MALVHCILVVLTMIFFLVEFGVGLMKLKLNTAQQSSLKLVEARLHLVVLNWIIITKELTCKILSRVGWAGGYILPWNWIVFQPGPFRHGISFHDFKSTIFLVGDVCKFRNKHVKEFTLMEDSLIINFCLTLSPVLPAWTRLRSKLPSIGLSVKNGSKMVFETWPFQLSIKVTAFFLNGMGKS